MPLETDANANHTTQVVGRALAAFLAAFVVGLPAGCSGGAGATSSDAPTASALGDSSAAVDPDAVEQLRTRLRGLDIDAAPQGRISTRRVLIPRGPGAVMAATVGDNLGRAARGFLDAREQSEAASRLGTERVAAARELFWKLYPNKRGFDEASALLADELFRKDVTMLLRDGMRRMTSSGNPMSQKPEYLSRGVGQMLGSSNDYDGGVPPNAVQLFSQWVKASFPTQRTMTFGNLNGAETAFSEHRDKYDSYVLARDRYEFWKAGREKDLFPTPEAFAEYLARVGRIIPTGGISAGLTMTEQEAAEWVAEQKAMFGEEAFRDAFEKLRVAEKGPEGALEEPGALGLQPMTYHLGDAALEVLGQQSERAYLLTLLWNFDDPHAKMREWFDQHGEEVVLDYARQVKDAPRAPSDTHDLLTNEAMRDLNVTTPRLSWAFIQIMERLGKPPAIGELVGVPNVLSGLTVLDDEQYTIGDPVSNGELLAMVRYDNERGRQHLDLLTFDPDQQKHLLTVKVSLPEHRDGRLGSFGPSVSKYLTLGGSRYAAISCPRHQSDRFKSQGVVMLANLETGEVLPPLLGPTPPSREEYGYSFGEGVAIDGEYVAIGAPGEPIPAWNGRDYQVSNAGSVSIYRVGDPEPLHRLRPTREYFDKDNEYSGPQFGDRLLARNGRLIVIMSQMCERYAAVVYDLATGEKLSEIERTGGDVRVTRATTDGTRLALVSLRDPPINEEYLASVVVHDLDTGSLLACIDRRFPANCRGLLLSGDLIGVTDEEILRVVKLKTGERLGETPFIGQVLPGSRSGRPAGTPWELEPSSPVTFGGCLAFLGNPRVTGHCAWCFDLASVKQ